MVSGHSQLEEDATYGAAPNSFFFVSDRMAENILVITATNRLMSQKFRTKMQTM